MSLRSRSHKDSKTDIDIFDNNGYVNSKNKDHQDRDYYHHTISWHWCIVTLTISCLLYYLVHYSDHVLPKAVTIDDLVDNKNVFSGEQSREYLRQLAALGPRAAGDDANEIHAPQFIMEEAEKISREAKNIHSIKIERQRGSGAYTMAYENKPAYTNVYDQISNVVVMLEGSVGDHSVLLNCHYDTMPEVEGASDDAVSCAVMLETLRALSNDDVRPKHNVVFLFNGAEEVGLLGSHLFTQHPWSDKARVVINLEAAGSGGRELLFQSGPDASWLFKYYAKYAPHPHSQVLVEEMFQQGIIPSDTDFRIFRDYKNLRGLDMAFGRNGYVYHTKYDKEIYIPVGSHQHMGDNVLAILRPLANAPELEDMDGNAGGQMVFFDYIGWFMISYSVGVGIAINIIAILLTVLSIFVFIKRLSTTDNDSPDEKYFAIQHKLNAKTIACELLIALAARFAGIALAVGFVALLSAIINGSATLTMIWFSNSWLIFPIYWCPVLVISSLVPDVVSVWRSRVQKMSALVVTHINLVASQVPHMLILLILTVAGFRSASVMFLPVISSAVALLVIHLTPLYRTANYWIWTYLLIQLFSFIMSLYFVLIGYIVLLPIMGRQGVSNPEIYIGLVSSILCVFLSTFLLPLMSLVKRSYIVYILISLFSIITLILCVNTDIGFPYKAGPDSPSPQRNWIMHLTRELRNDSNYIRRSESGFFVLSIDVNSRETIPMTKSPIMSLEADCEQELFCGMPLYSIRYIDLNSQSSWIPAPAPVQPSTSEVILKRKSCVNDACTLYVSIKGSDRLSLTFVPRSGATLIDWSIQAQPVRSLTWKGNPAYLIYICRGSAIDDFEIVLTFKVSEEQQSGKPIMDIALASNYVHHEDYRTIAYREFLNSFPDWTDRTGYISAFNSYVF